MASLLRKKWILNSLLDPSTLSSQHNFFAQITRVHLLPSLLYPPKASRELHVVVLTLRARGAGAHVRE
jgi:hypothetical protein